MTPKTLTGCVVVMLVWGVAEEMLLVDTVRLTMLMISSVEVCTATWTL